MDLTEFLTARVDEDEAAAKAAAARGGSIWPNSDYENRTPELEHARRHDPARALREVEAKRAILAAHMPGEFGYRQIEILCRTCVTGHYVYMDDDAADPWPCVTVRALAAIWNGHPDYRDEWKP